MRYRTVIELICDASDRDEACNIAGEYLKGDIDFGVEMKFRTISLLAHKAKKYATCVAAFLVSLTFLTAFTPTAANDEGNFQNSLFFKLKNTCTVMPVLKTKHKVAFKDEWTEKKDKAVLEYLKK